jgi:hypothetical protein
MMLATLKEAHEMSHLLSGPTPKAAAAAAELSPAPVVITEQRVAFGTVSAISAAPARTYGRWLAEILVAAMHRISLAVKPGPPKPYLGRELRYLQDARMSREMERL